MPPNITRNLEPGMSGNDIRSLQDWLKTKGFFPNSQVSTGYYGDITKQAIAAWQKSVGIDTGQYAGYFGPKSREYISQTSSTINPSTALRTIDQTLNKTSQTEQPSQNMVSNTVSNKYQSFSTPAKISNYSGYTQNYEIIQDPDGQFHIRVDGADNYFKFPSIDRALAEINKSQAGINFLGVKYNSQAPSSTQPQIPTSQSSVEDGLYNSLKSYLDQLQQRGQVLNPNIELTPEKVAEFMGKAEREIDPFYSTQLKLAREELLTSLGYSQSQLLDQEKELERKYGKNLRAIGEQAAETGFAQSGRRIEQERELASGTQSEIESGRRQLEFGAGRTAAAFAKQYGKPPEFSISDVPQVSAGESNFSRPTTSRSLYQLSPDIYDSLVGEQEFQRRAAIKNRVSELEQAYRTGQSLDQARQLNF